MEMFHKSAIGKTRERNVVVNEGEKIKVMANASVK